MYSIPLLLPSFVKLHIAQTIPYNLRCNAFLLTAVSALHLAMVAGAGGWEGLWGGILSQHVDSNTFLFSTLQIILQLISPKLLVLILFYVPYLTIIQQ
jgi:hypothetical protein